LSSGGRQAELLPVRGSAAGTRDIRGDDAGGVPVQTAALVESAAWLTAITVTSRALNVQRCRARVERGMRRRPSRNPGILTP
jgi:hypothetical protein